MPKKKGSKKNVHADFTINDCANAQKPVSRVKKSVTETAAPVLSWEDIQDDDFDLVEEVNEDGSKNFVYKKKRNRSKSESDNIDNSPGVVYPEIVWYLVSQYIKPEEVKTFALINRVTYDITRRESFWRMLYRRHCQNHPKLPERLRIENGYKLYGLRQRVVRALYHTYDVFNKKVSEPMGFASELSPHSLIERQCINVWYSKVQSYWSVYFKFKKLRPQKRIEGFIEELGRIDANPDENAQVLLINCKTFYEVPPIMGMTLTSVSIVLTQGFHRHRVHLGFNSGHHNPKAILPEISVVLDTVVNILVFDWWHPRYPHFDNILPASIRGEEALPVLKKDFFAIRDTDL